MTGRALIFWPFVASKMPPLGRGMGPKLTNRHGLGLVQCVPPPSSPSHLRAGRKEAVAKFDRLSPMDRGYNWGMARAHRLFRRIGVLLLLVSMAAGSSFGDPPCAAGRCGMVGSASAASQPRTPIGCCKASNCRVTSCCCGSRAPVDHSAAPQTKTSRDRDLGVVLCVDFEFALLPAVGLARPAMASVGVGLYSASLQARHVRIQT